MATNQILPFCPTDTGTNLLSNSDYNASSGRTDGNQPGVASSKLNNKALRQASLIASQMAQFISDTTQTDVTDVDGIEATLLTQINASLKLLPPILTVYNSGSSNHHGTVVFFIASGNATAGAVYTNNSFSFTVPSTISGGVMLTTTGTGAPTVSGTLTKFSGTGDATLTFHAYRSAISISAKVLGSGGGGGGGGTGGTPSDGFDGATSSFGNLSAGGGLKGLKPTTTDGLQLGGGGGAPTVGAGWTGFGINGQHGGKAQGSSGLAFYPIGALGGSSVFGGGFGVLASNSGCGGNGGTGTTGSAAGSGGGGGAYVEAQTVGTPAIVYAYVVATGGAGGTAGSGSDAGVNGSNGLVIVREDFQ